MLNPADSRPQRATPPDERAAAAPGDLAAAARAEMLAEGFEVEWGAEARAELAALADAVAPDAHVRDLRDLDWSSIDNADTRDLDQLEVARATADGSTLVMIAVADVTTLVRQGGAIDRFAAHNTTSVYTGVETFNMLPERLSTDLTSLRLGVDRRAFVVEYSVTAGGDVERPAIYRAVVRNRAQLAYEPVAAWLEAGAAAEPSFAPPEIAAQLRLQDEAARRLRARRFERGALQLETVEARPVMRDGVVVDLEVVTKNRARELIEDFMIAANVGVAEWLRAAARSSIRRVVRAPERWNRIVALARTLGTALPEAPDAAALSAFLEARRAADPAHFGDLSLSVVKLLGPGQYAVERAGGTGEGHFGLAVDDYAHSTAPNRRYADLVTQRVIEATLCDAPPPYGDAELDAIAARCTEMENAARKVERVLRKKAAAGLLDGRVGETFDAVVTGAKPRATYVRLLRPPVEGRVVRGEQGLDVGDKVRVRLLETDVRDGFIDFEAEGGAQRTAAGV